MNVEELKTVLTTSGWSCRVSHGEVELEVCYYCGNDRFNLGLSPDKGVYHCWACRKGGRLSEILKALTGQHFDISVQQSARKKAPSTQKTTAAEFKSMTIAEVPSAERYLVRRGITAEVAAQYGMVVCVDSGHRLEGRIALQLKDFWTGDLVAWVGRSYTGREPKYISTLIHRVITGWRMRDKDTPVVLVEGPIDGVAAHRAGYQAGVLSGVGAAGAVEWASRLSLSAPVVIMLDADAVGQATRLYWQLFPVLAGRLSIVKFEDGTADPAQVGPDGIRTLVDQAIRGLGHTLA